MRALKLLCMAILSPDEKQQCDVVVYRNTRQMGANRSNVFCHEAPI